MTDEDKIEWPPEGHIPPEARLDCLNGGGLEPQPLEGTPEPFEIER